MKKLLYAVIIVTVILATWLLLNDNKQEVTVSYLNQQWTHPLALVLLATWIAGAVIGYSFSMLNSLRLRGRLMKANRQIKKHEKAAL